jgi:hypothetical protein
MAKASGDRGFGGYVIALLANQVLYRGLTGKSSSTRRPRCATPAST